jgi:hypothetical protein
MSFSLKNMLFSFALGLVLFSLIMVAVSVSAFNSEVKVISDDSAITDRQSVITSIDRAIAVKKIDDDGALDYAVLILFDESSKNISVTPVCGDYLMNYKNSLSYVSGVYKNLGDEAIVELFKALSGISVDCSDVVILEESWDCGTFLDKILSKSKDISDWLFNGVQYQEVIDFPLTITVTQTQNSGESISIIDTESCVSQFKKLFGLK